MLGGGRSGERVGVLGVEERERERERESESGYYGGGRFCVVGDSTWIDFGVRRQVGCFDLVSRFDVR